MKLLQPLNKRIVCYGMSCVGKTTFAKQMHSKYHCFDALFQWHLIEAFGLSIKLMPIILKKESISLLVI